MDQESRQATSWAETLTRWLRESGLCRGERLERPLSVQVWPEEAAPSGLARGIQVCGPGADAARPACVCPGAEGDALDGHLSRLAAASRLAGELQGRETLCLGRGRLSGPEGATGPLLLWPVRLERWGAQWLLCDAGERERTNTAALALLPPECPPPAEGWSGYWNTLTGQLTAALEGREDWSWEDGFCLCLLPLWALEAAGAACDAPIAGTLGAALAAGEPVAGSEDSGEDGEALLTPLPLDEAQAQVLHRLRRGEHTLLSGAIASGKRQTAAALVVNAMSRGARTLILSPREADREEIYARLKPLELAPFCLRIPSHGDRRAAVLQQYNIAAQLHPDLEGEGFFTLSQQLEQLAQRLDRPVAALHTPGKHGLTPFQLVCRYLREEETEGALPLPEPMLSHLDREGLEERFASAGALAGAAQAIGSPAGHPLRLVWGSEYDPERASQIPQAAKSLLDRLESLEEAGRQWCERTGLELPDRREEWGRLCESAALLLEWRDYPASWARSSRLPLLMDAVVELEKRTRRAARLHAEIASRWEAPVFRLDAVALEQQWQYLREGWTLPTEPERERQLRQLLSQAESLLGSLELAGRRWANAVERAVPNTRERWERNYEIAVELARWKDIPSEWGECASLQALLWDVGELIDHGKRARESREVLLRDWTEDFLTQDGNALLARWQQEGGRWGLGWLRRQTSVRAELEPFCRVRLTAEVLENGLRWLADYQEEIAQCDEIYHRWEHELGSVYHREDTVWIWLESARVVAAESHDWLAELTGSDDFLRRFGSSDEAVAAAGHLKESWEGARSVLGRLDVMVGRTGQPDSRDWLAERRSDCRRLRNLMKIRRHLQDCAKAESVSLGEIGQELALFAQHQREREAIAALYDRWRDELEGLFREEETDWEELHTMSIRAVNADEALAELTGDLGLRAQLAGDAGAQACAQALCEGFRAAQEESERFAGLTCAQLEQDGGPWLDQLRESSQIIVSHLGALEAWMRWRAESRRADRLGLTSFVRYLEEPEEHPEAASLFRKSLCRALLKLELDWLPELSQFSARQTREMLRQYAGLQERFDRAACAEVRSRAIARLPDYTREEEIQEERGMLSWANQTAHCDVPVPELIGVLPQVTERTFSCVLASPADALRLYEAQRSEYAAKHAEEDSAGPEQPPFDYVVLLGAESLPEPVGRLALMLGRTALVCAGEGALPEAAFPPWESVWDACRRLGMAVSALPQCYLACPEDLRWLPGALSRTPCLPGPDPCASSCVYKTVVGRLEDGVNLAEAAAVAEHAAGLVRGGARSLAIVTLTAGQAEQIAWQLAHLDEEGAVARKLASLPVRPVQTLAGERWETVLLSVTLASDVDGGLSAARALLDSWPNAAPLARLAAAVGRRLVIFSSLDQGEGDGWDGVAGTLAALLDRARREETTAEEERHPCRSELERCICRALEQAGCHAEPGPAPVSVQVRASRAPGAWQLGILLDDEGYAACQDTRARELTQPDLLRRQGWEICRVWTMDWLLNREKVTGQIRHLLDLMAERTRAEEPPAPDEDREPELYTPAHLKLIPIRPGEVASPAFRDRIYRVAEQVLELEAPVAQEQLTDRMLLAFGLDHRDEDLRRNCASLWRKLGLRMTREEEQNFFWRTGQDPEHYRQWRRSGTGEHDRRPQDVSCQEAANAVCEILRQEVAMTARALMARTLQNLGYTPEREGAIACAARGLEHALYMGRVLETPIGSVAINAQPL